MNKKGFTLMEVAISLMLVSTVVLFIINFVSLISTDEDSINLNTQFEMTKSLISNSLNADIKKNGGIKSIDIIDGNYKITLNSSLERTLSLSEDNTILTYKDDTSNKILFSRKEVNGYFYSINYTPLETVYIINIVLSESPNYDVDIVSEKISEATEENNENSETQGE